MFLHCYSSNLYLILEVRDLPDGRPSFTCRLLILVCLCCIDDLFVCVGYSVDRHRHEHSSRDHHSRGRERDRSHDRHDDRHRDRDRSRRSEPESERDHRRDRDRERERERQRGRFFDATPAPQPKPAPVNPVSSTDLNSAANKAMEIAKSISLASGTQYMHMI